MTIADRARRDIHEVFRVQGPLSRPARLSSATQILLDHRTALRKTLASESLKWTNLELGIFASQLWSIDELLIVIAMEFLRLGHDTQSHLALASTVESLFQADVVALGTTMTADISDDSGRLFEHAFRNHASRFHGRLGVGVRALNGPLASSAHTRASKYYQGLVDDLQWATHEDQRLNAAFQSMRDRDATNRHLDQTCLHLAHLRLYTPAELAKFHKGQAASLH